jgi:hypothetical protein
METVTVSLYKKGYADPSYKHLTNQVTTDEPDYVMQNASVVKVGQKDAVRFDIPDGTSYYNFLACKYMKITTQSDAGDIWCFIQHIDYKNPKTIFIYYTIDYWHSFSASENISGNAFIERSGLYENGDPIKAPDAAIPAGTPNILVSSAEIYKPDSPKIIVYYRKVKGGSDPVTLTRYGELDTSKLATSSYSRELKDLSGTGDSVSGSYPNLAKLSLGNAKINAAIPSVNSTSQLCYKAVNYDGNGMVELFNSPDLWNASGSTIVGAEIRENYGDPGDDGTYSATVSSDTPSVPDKIPDYLRKNPFISYKLESNFGSVELNPSQIEPGAVKIEMIDSVYPGSHPIYKVEGYPASSRAGSLAMIDGQDRSINLFTDEYFGHFYSQRNRINTKISNFIRSFNAKIVSIYAGFDAKMASVENSNSASIAGVHNSQFATDANTRQGNATSVLNLKTTQDNSVANLKRSNDVSVNNLHRSNQTQMSNVENTNAKALDTLDSNFELTNKNLDNSYNTSQKDNEISFDAKLAGASVGALEGIVGKGVTGALNALLQGILTGGLNLATANAKLDNQINGAGKAPSGEKQRAIDTNDTQKTNLNRTQQAQVQNLGNSQGTSQQNLEDSNQAQVDNLAASNTASLTVLNNNNSLKIATMKNSFAAQNASTDNSTYVAMANLYNGMAESIQSFLPGAEAEAENFMDTLAAEIEDFKGASNTVSGGTGFAYGSLKNGQIWFNIYSVSDSVLTKAKNYVKTYGLAIGRNKNLSDYFGNSDAQLTATGYKNEFYLKTQGARIDCPTMPLEGINQISAALDSGVWIEGGSSND